MNDHTTKTDSLSFHEWLLDIGQHLKCYVYKRERLFWWLHCLIMILLGWIGMVATGLIDFLFLSIVVVIILIAIKFFQTKVHLFPRLSAFRHLGPELEFSRFLLISLIFIGMAYWIIAHPY